MFPDRPAKISIEPIGVARTPYQTPSEAPHQGFADDTEATIEIFEPYRQELEGLELVHRITVLYWAHLVDRSRNKESDGDGAFSRRGPSRPNPINLCTCLVLSVEGPEIQVTGLDAVDGSPVIDVKPTLQAER